MKGWEAVAKTISCKGALCKKEFGLLISQKGVIGCQLADINIQTLQKYREAAIVEKKLNVFDRVVGLRDSALDSKS